MESFHSDNFDNCKGVGCVIYHGMLKHRNQIAQIETTTGLKDTYESLLERCIRTAIELRRRGLKRSDIVSVCAVNNLNSCVPFIACQFIGVQIASLDSQLTNYEIVHILKIVKPRLIFVGIESIKLIEKALNDCGNDVSPEIVVFGHTLDGVYCEFEEFVTKKNDTDSFSPIEIDNPEKEVSVIHFSSGTTGLPKGICFSHQTLINKVLDIGRNFPLVYLLYETPYWLAFTLLNIICAITGSTRIIAPKFKPSTFWRFVETYKVNFIITVTTVAYTLCTNGRPEGVSTASLKYFVVTGEPISLNTLQKLVTLFPDTCVRQTYGSTELAGGVLGFYKEDSTDLTTTFKKLGSSGRPLKGHEVKVVDPVTNKALQPHQTGELRVKSTKQLIGYYNQDSSNIWDSDGWLKTGDLGYYDEDGYFYIIDRLKELIKYRSYHVPPAIIEEVLLQHPKVSSAVVVGIPNEEDGEHPAAAIILKCGFDTTTSDEFETYVENLGDRFKLRGGVKFVVKLPVTASGKIKRNEVKKLFQLNIV